MAQSVYSQTLVDLWIERATTTGTVGSPYALAIVEGCLSLYERAFQMATVHGAEIQPDLLALIVRQNLTTGEFVGQIQLDAEAQVHIYPAAQWTVWGDHPDPRSWFYHCSIPTPSHYYSEYIPAMGVVHTRPSASAIEPWRGIPPIERIPTTSQLAREIERGLIEEAQVPTGRIIPVPEGSTVSSWWESFKHDVDNLRGTIAYPEIMRTGGGLGPAAAPSQDWQPITLRPEYDRGVMQARQDVAISLTSIYGIPPELLFLSGEGTSMREAWRRCLYGAILPQSRVIAAELTLKLEREVTISHRDLAASDLQGRARAFRSLIGGQAGLTIDQGTRAVNLDGE